MRAQRCALQPQMLSPLEAPLSWAALALSVFLAGVYASAMSKERVQRSETIGPLTESWAAPLRRRHQKRMLRKLGAERKEVAKIQ